MSKRGGWYNASGGASERRFGPGYGGGLDAWRTGEVAPLGHPEGDPPRLRQVSLAPAAAWRLNRSP
jgi:hypothetical protein